MVRPKRVPAKGGTKKSAPDASICDCEVLEHGYGAGMSKHGGLKSSEHSINVGSNVPIITHSDLLASFNNLFNLGFETLPIARMQIQMLLKLLVV
jgi:hypothetical protein